MRLFFKKKGKKASPKNPKKFLENIKRKVSEKTGITEFVDLGETAAAFSGTVDRHDLYVSCDVIKKKKKDFLYVYMADHFEWYEWKYKSQSDFEDAIVEYLCSKINKTIKTVTETKKHKYIRVTKYYLDKAKDEWVLISDDKTSYPLLLPLITEDSLTERVDEYKL